MRLYDVLMIALLALLAVRGARRGLVRELAGLAAYAIGFLLAYRLDAPLGRRLNRALPSLTPTEARVLAFLAVLVVTGVAIDLGARFVAGAIHRVPIVGGLDRLGGLLAGAALGVLLVWLVTTCLLLLPMSVVPSAAGVHRSGTAHLVHNLPAAWGRGLRDHLERMAYVP
jgi:uncharacterized membrane protein required for colicin V production